MRQSKLFGFGTESKSYGGLLFKTRKGRSGPRPLDTKNTMHLVLRSSKAIGPWSFRKARHAARIRKITQGFAAKYGVKILSMANVGNHLHFHLKLTNRFTYKPFIRAVTAAIAMAVTGASRWKPLKKIAPNESKARFWDYRPYTRVIQGFRAFLNVRDYVKVNQLEGCGYTREEARFAVAWRAGPARS